MQTEIEQLVFLAKNNEKYFEELVNNHSDFILRSASSVTKTYITKSSDEWSIALSAFHEAVLSYSEEKGSFFPFAQLVIKRRITDYLRKRMRGEREISVAPGVFSATIDDDEAADKALQAQILKKITVTPQDDITLEIAALSQTLSEYGFSFMDLTDSSPKAGKTKQACAQAIAVVLKNPDILAHLKVNKTLPIKLLEKNFGLHRKILERHRKYIIAAVEILIGDYPYLAEYMRFVRTAMEE